MKVSWGWQHPMAVRVVAVHPLLPLAVIPVQQEWSWSHTSSPLQVASAAHALPDSQDHPGGCSCGEGNTGGWPEPSHALDKRARHAGYAMGDLLSLLTGRSYLRGPGDSKDWMMMDKPCPVERALGSHSHNSQLGGMGKHWSKILTRGGDLRAHPTVVETPHISTEHRPSTSSVQECPSRSTDSTDPGILSMPGVPISVTDTHVPT